MSNVLPVPTDYNLVQLLEGFNEKKVNIALEVFYPYRIVKISETNKYLLQLFVTSFQGEIIFRTTLINTALDLNIGSVLLFQTQKHLESYLLKIQSHPGFAQVLNNNQDFVFSQDFLDNNFS